MAVTPYLTFEGRCEEAIEFYKKALGAEVGMMMRFKEAPEQPPPGMLPPGSDNKIMHASLRINGADVMASDGCSHNGPKFEGFSLSLNARDEAHADRTARPSSPSASAWSPTASAWAGWSSWRIETKLRDD